MVLGLFGRKYLGRWAGLIGTMALLVSTVLALSIFSDYFFTPRSGNPYLPQVPFRLDWLSFGQGLSIDMGLMLDPLSVMMIAVVTFVSLMVHV